MFNITRIAESKKDYWNSEIQRFEMVHPLNAFGWGAVRRVDKWKPIYLVAENDGLVRGMMMVLVKKIPYTPYSIMYSPKGPVWDYDDRETLAALVDEARRIGDEHNAIFLRIDPNIKEDAIAEGKDPFEMLGFIHLEHRWTFWNSPRDVSRIDLTRVDSAEAYFNILGGETRRLIRKAAKDGVSIEPATEESELEAFYDIFNEFSVTKGFMARSYDYQKMLWEEYLKPGRGKLLLVRYHGQIIGGGNFIMFGKKCLGMHMGTPRKYLKLNPNYAFIWENIKLAKMEGCSWFSFRGVGTTPSQEQFKKKFKPEVVRLVGYYDLPLKPSLYRMLNFSEFTVLPKAWPYLISMRDKLHKTRIQR